MSAEKGISLDSIYDLLRSNTTLLGSLALKRGEGDGMICMCDSESGYNSHLTDIHKIIGMGLGISHYSAMSMCIVRDNFLFFTDTHVSAEPSAMEIADSTILASQAICSLGMRPKVSVLFHSNSGSHCIKSSLKMRDLFCRWFSGNMCISKDM